MRIDDERPADIPAVEDVVRRSFGDDGGRVVDLVRALRASSAVRPGLSLVARDDERVIGHVLLTRSWLDAPDRLVEVLVLSPLAVAPDAQGQGIGSALVAASLERADELGWPLVFLEGDPRFYAARGFAPAGPLGFDAPSDRIPPVAFQVAVLAAHEPSMTGRLVYADPFWAQDCVGLR
jgi:putative acetyltransferase